MNPIGSLGIPFAISKVYPQLYSLGVATHLFPAVFDHHSGNIASFLSSERDKMMNGKKGPITLLSVISILDNIVNELTFLKVKNL